MSVVKGGFVDVSMRGNPGSCPVSNIGLKQAASGKFKTRDFKIFKNCAMRSEMKMLLSGIFIIMSSFGCQKDNIAAYSLSKLKLFDKTLIQHPILAQPINTCVLNYKHLFLILDSYEVIISAVVLEDGTIIQTRQTVTGMAYKAVEKKEDYSLF